MKTHDADLMARGRALIAQLVEESTHPDTPQALAVLDRLECVFDRVCGCPGRYIPPASEKVGILAAVEGRHAWTAYLVYMINGWLYVDTYERLERVWVGKDRTVCRTRFGAPVELAGRRVIFTSPLQFVAGEWRRAG